MKMKRILAGVLSAAMVLTCAPVSVLAAGRGELKVVDDTVNEANEEAAAAENPVAAVSAAVDSATADSAASEEAAADSTTTDPAASDTENTFTPGATVTENEVIFVPNEDGTFADFNSTDNADVMTFLNTVTDFEVTVVYKFANTSSLSATSYALFTLADDDGTDYFTVRHAPKRDASNGDIAWAYNGSGTGLKFQHTSFVVNDTKWHKLSFSMSSSKKMNTAYDGSAPLTDNWGASDFCPSSFPGTTGTPTTYDHAYIGKVAPGKTYASAVGSNVNFPGTIKYVKVSKTPVANRASLVQINTSVDEISSNAWADTKAKYADVTAAAGNYTAASWSTFTEKMNANPSTECEMLNAADDLDAAYAALEESTAETKAAALTALEAEISNAEPFKNAPDTIYTSGYSEFAAAFDQASEVVNDADNHTELQIQDATTALTTAFDALVFADKVSTNVAPGTDLYESADSLFYNKMNCLAFTTAFKFDDTIKFTHSSASSQIYPLFTLANDNAYFSFYYQPHPTANKTEGKFYISYTGSGSTLAFTMNKNDARSLTNLTTGVEDNAYHKLTFSICGTECYLALDGNNAARASQVGIASNPTWFSKAIELLKSNSWTQVLVGQKYTGDTYATGTAYQSTWPADVKCVEFSRTSCESTSADKAELEARNASLSAFVTNECSALTNYCENILTADDYTETTWTSYNTAKTTFDAATTEWAKWDAIAPLETAVYGLERLYTVTATAGTVSGSSVAADSSKFEFLQEATVTAPETNEEGQTFACWKMSVNGSEAQTVCYNHSYTFYVIDSVTMTPCYAAAETPVEEAFTVLCNASFNPGTGKMTFTSKRSIPEGYTIVGHGIIITDNEADKDTLDLNTTGKKTARATTTGLLGTYKATLNCKTSATWYGRAYVTYADSQGNEATVYSDIVPCNVTVK